MMKAAMPLFLVFACVSVYNNFVINSRIVTHFSILGAVMDKNVLKKLIKNITKIPVMSINTFFLSTYLKANKSRTQIQELDIQGDKVLILSPHEDDETLGCGSLIQKLIENKCTVQCVFMTDGRNSLSFEYDCDSMSKVREEEATLVSNFFSMYPPAFLRCLDGELTVNEFYTSKLVDVINEFNPDYIFFPYFLDALSDHSATSGLLLSAIDMITESKKIKFFAYEINNPISIYGVNSYIDGTKYIEKKKEALTLYKSQIMAFDSIILMNRLNRHLVHKNCTHVELFMEVDITSYKYAYHKYNLNHSIYKQFRPMYSIYYMLPAYFKGMSIKLEVAKFLNMSKSQ